MPSSQPLTTPRWAITVITALTLIAALLLSAGTASALTSPTAENRIQASASAAQTLGWPLEGVSADQRLGNEPPQTGIVVATGVAANTADDFVDLASAQRRTHILDGDHTGGGHRWPGADGKTPFPEGWSDDEIMHHVSDIATDPKANWTGGGPGGSAMTRRGNPARFSVFGERGGTCIKVVVEPAGEGIITAHPAAGRC